MILGEICVVISVILPILELGIDSVLKHNKGVLSRLLKFVKSIYSFIVVHCFKVGRNLLTIVKNKIAERQFQFGHFYSRHDFQKILKKIS